jgi:hypothetical protein
LPFTCPEFKLKSIFSSGCFYSGVIWLKISHPPNRANLFLFHQSRPKIHTRNCMVYSGMREHELRDDRRHKKFRLHLLLIQSPSPSTIHLCILLSSIKKSPTFLQGFDI